MPRSNDCSESSRLSSPCSMRTTSCSSSSSDFSNSAIRDVSVAAFGMGAKTSAARRQNQSRADFRATRLPFDARAFVAEQARAGLAEPEIGDREQRAAAMEQQRQATALPRRDAGFL